MSTGCPYSADPDRDPLGHPCAARGCVDGGLARGGRVGKRSAAESKACSGRWERWVNVYASPRYGDEYQMSAAINCTGVIHVCSSSAGLAEPVWLY